MPSAFLAIPLPDATVSSGGTMTSPTWDVSDATHTYHLVETNGSVIVQVPGGADFPLPDDAQSTLDLGSVNAEIVAAFKAQCAGVCEQRDHIRWLSVR